MNLKTLFSPTLHNPRMLGVSNMRLFDAVVGPNRNEGDYTQVDQAIDAGALSIFIKPGTYNKFTADVENLYIAGPGRNVLIDGGISGHAISVAAANITICNIACKTTPGGGNTYYGVNADSNADGVQIIGVHVIDSDDVGIMLNAPDDGFVFGCQVDDADGNGIQALGLRPRILSNYVKANGTTGLNLGSAADNFLVVGNHIVNSIGINGGVDNGIVDGNISDTSVSDSGTGNTIGDNEIY